MKPPQIKLAKRKILELLSTHYKSQYAPFRIFDVAVPWGIDAEDIKAAVLALNGRGHITLQKLDEQHRWIQGASPDIKWEQWFFYHSNFEMRITAEGLAFLEELLEHEETAKSEALRVSPARQVQPIHFEDLSGKQFERLVYAYLLRAHRWQRTPEWHGQSGGDDGRDIVGVLDDGSPRGKLVFVQCANRKELPFQKIADDLEKIAKGVAAKPDQFWVVTASQISANFRERVRKYAASFGIPQVDIWSGNEFEELLRSRAESLLKRFTEGEPFPDSPKELNKLISGLPSGSDGETLRLMAELFDRPAFITPFQRESSIFAFKKAITDTIEALNTGIHRLRDGTEIRRIPSRHQLNDSATKSVLKQIVDKLTLLRESQDDLMQRGELKPCGCEDGEDCPTWFISVSAAGEMDRLRRDILVLFHGIYPSFSVRLHGGTA